jgi:hypothetical protein
MYLHRWEAQKRTKTTDLPFRARVNLFLDAGAQLGLPKGTSRAAGAGWGHREPQVSLESHFALLCWAWSARLSSGHLSSGVTLRWLSLSSSPQRGCRIKSVVCL